MIQESHKQKYSVKSRIVCYETVKLYFYSLPFPMDIMVSIDRAQKQSEEQYKNILKYLILTDVRTHAYNKDRQIGKKTDI